ncbi:helix-turn-helix transcriptional regulator [uncultured Polaribacter sp.]|uniref:helix-turn-helix domain-containing protein n=1 Tax=uncultured Polaribacter sp. TaxID=174711 RepID=UPI00262C11AA|nr:helix-turn-helix transcriptional regulator [uncultured Polaribacter sp.]
MVEKDIIDTTHSKILRKIVILRRNAGLSQVELADAIGISESGYFKVEKGKTKLDLERLLIILLKLKISPKEFFKDIELNF